MKKSFWLALLIVLIIATAVSFYFAVDPMMTKTGEATPSVVRVGVLPDMSVEGLQQRYNPLLNYLSDETGFEFTLVLPADYGELLKHFGRGEIDLALFGGLTFVKAKDLYQAEPLVMRDVDMRFVSAFVVRNSDPATDLADFKGKVLAFGSRLSTSGHLMPRYFLQDRKQITPEAFFSQVDYSGAHDSTAYMVRDGEADVGAVNVEIMNGMLRDGRLKPGDLRVIWETPPYPDYVWAVPGHLGEDIRTPLRDAYLGLDLNDEYHGQILADLGARSFLPAGAKIFGPLQEIATNLGLLGTK